MTQSECCRQPTSILEHAIPATSGTSLVLFVQLSCIEGFKIGAHALRRLLHAPARRHATQPQQPAISAQVLFTADVLEQATPETARRFTRLAH